MYSQNQISVDGEVYTGKLHSCLNRKFRPPGNPVESWTTKVDEGQIAIFRQKVASFGLKTL